MLAIKGYLSFIIAVFLHRCPACVRVSIYCRWFSLKDNCDVCGFELKKHDVGDAAAFFAVFITGTIVAVCAVLAEIVFGLSFWLHFVIWLPFSVVLAFFALKLFKSLFIALQYRHNVFNYSDR